jgi:integrative and conjugative element protein (TIGR02256 family)
MSRPDLLRAPSARDGQTLPAVTVTDTACASMNRYATASADGRETGGILLGRHHARPRPVLDVVHAAGPGPRAVRRPDFFRRDVRHAQSVADLVHQTDTSVWIGDWHTHPGGPARPSDTDLASYRALLMDSELGFEVFLTIIVTADPAAGWTRPLATGWLITTACVFPARLPARLPDWDIAR